MTETDVSFWQDPEDLILLGRPDKRLQHWMSAQGNSKTAYGRSHMADMLVHYLAYRWQKKCDEQAEASPDTVRRWQDGSIMHPPYYYMGSLHHAIEQGDRDYVFTYLHPLKSELGTNLLKDSQTKEGGWVDVCTEHPQDETLLLMPINNFDERSPAATPLARIGENRERECNTDGSFGDEDAYYAQSRFIQETLNELGLPSETLGYAHRVFRLGGGGDSSMLHAIAIDIDYPAHELWHKAMDTILSDPNFIQSYEKNANSHARRDDLPRFVIQHPFTRRVVNRETAIEVLKHEFEKHCFWPVKHGVQSEFDIEHINLVHQFMIEQGIAFEELGLAEADYRVARAQIQANTVTAQRAPSHSHNGRNQSS